ncbi:MAG: 3-dehydroquinate synthase family protein [bacterium]|nr:3-dehydroquinate synthase family protein [bacterium]
MKTIKTTYTHEFPVSFIIDNDPGMKFMAEFRHPKGERFFILIDKEVSKKYGDQIKKLLGEHRKKMFFLEVSAKEESKSIYFYPKAVEFLERHRAGLFDLVIAIGGGIVIDLAGFVSSTYMRGLPLFLVPTTLIGQTDASTAGKTCLNTKNSKNVLGTFYYPSVVYNNVYFIKDHSPYYTRQGLSEVFKYGLLDSPDLLNLFEKYRKKTSDELLKKMVGETINVRVRIRKKHPLASNLGHTFGHAIEKLSRHKVLHGDAISAGTVLALMFAVSRGIMQESRANFIISSMKKNGLNVYIDSSYTPKNFVALMRRDKKSSDSKINLVLITDIGKPYRKGVNYFYSVSPKDMEEFLSVTLKEYPWRIKNMPLHVKNSSITYHDNN